MAQLPIYGTPHPSQNQGNIAPLSPRLFHSELKNLRDGELGSWGDGEVGSWGVGEMGSWEVGEMGSWGDGEMGRWGVFNNF